MTKFEYLKKSSSTENIYTWKSQGSLLAKDDTKIYNTDSLYYISNKKSALNGFLIFCKKEVQGNYINWINANLYDYNYGEISFGNDIVSPNFGVLLTKEEYDLIDQKSEEFKNNYKTFIPFNKLNTTGNVIISEEDYGLCLKPLGFPFVTQDELEYTKEEITTLAIKPALEEYFHWIPAVRPTVITATNNDMVVAMPSDAYCVVGLSLQQYGGSVQGNMLSPLFYGVEQSLYGSYNFSSLTGTYTGSTPYTQTSALTTMLNNRASAQALINLNRRVHYEGPYTIQSSEEAEKIGLKDAVVGSKYIKIYANNNGVFNIWWGIQTLDFNEIEFANRTRVIEYAQACVKELFGNLRSLARTEIPGQIDYSKWLSEANAKKKEIRDEWKKLVKFSGVMRGSL